MGQPNNEVEAAQRMYLGKTTEDALYNLAEDLGEEKNVAAEHPEVVTELKQLLADALKR
jgi:hypothetical protein